MRSPNPNRFHPIIHVRGYAGSESAVEETVATPYMGFNLGATKSRQRWDGKIVRHVFESPLVRLMKDYGLTETDGAPLMIALEYTNIGVIPAWLVNGIVFGLAVFMFLTLILAKSRPSKEDRYWSARSDESIDEFS